MRTESDEASKGDIDRPFADDPVQEQHKRRQAKHYRGQGKPLS
jgi:hypothetical protein